MPPRLCYPFPSMPDPLDPQVEAFVAALRATVPGTDVRVGGLDRAAYARDASPETFLERRHGVLPVPPGAVCWPASAEDVAALVRLAAVHRVGLVPFGAGSGVVQGLLPDARTVVMDLKRLDGVEIDARTRTVAAGAGVIGERLERALNVAGFTAGHFPSSIYCSTVGGWVAARSAGQLSSRYGKIEDMVHRLEIVDGTGAISTLERDRGADPARAIIGSEGALAVVTRAWLRIHQLASHHAVFGLAAPDVGTGVTFMRRVMQAGLRPAVFRMYDPPDTLLAGGIPANSEMPVVRVGPISRAGHEDGHMSGDAPAPAHGLFGLLARRATAALRREAGAGRLNPTVRHVLGAALAHTAWLAAPYERLPPACLMVLGFEGDADAVSEALASATAMAGTCGVSVLGVAPGERWLRRRHAVTYKMPPYIRAGGWADTLEVSAPWSVIERLYHEARSSLLHHAVAMAHFSHAYPEGGSIYFTFAGGGATLEDAVAHHAAAVRDALEAFSRLGASLSHHHGVGRMKSARLWDVLGPGSRDAVTGLKRALDPHGVLNPGVLGLGGRP
ncbi:MAG: FAD-binding oxidoreductase [Deltaproteobacteria bacterium]|nr:FAD-binding oxidoreductase [Deltaproteobacteria bacterium]